MEFKDRKLSDLKNNHKYYKESDGHYIAFENCDKADKVIDRIDWVAKWVYELGCDTHIDIGAKDGYLCMTLQKHGLDCVGIDPSEDAINEARKRAKMKGLDCTFIVGFAEEIPDTIRADSVSCLEVIEHVIDPVALLEKLTKIGRYVFISTPDSKGRHGLEDAKRNQEHLRVYDQKELEQLCSQFGIIKESVVRDDQICILLVTGN